MMLYLNEERLEIIMKRRGPRSALGEIGEQLVSQLLSAIQSTDPWDSEKDLVGSDGRRIEVKTQNSVTMHTHTPEFGKYFTIHWAQPGQKHFKNFEKCLNVDRLIFVEYFPINKFTGLVYNPQIHDVINIWECTERKEGTCRFTAADSRYPTGRVMFAWPASRMTLLHSEQNKPIADEMRKYSQVKK